MKKEIEDIMNSKNTIKTCPYCNYKNQYDKVMGIQNHIRLVHPGKYKGRADKIIDLFLSKIDKCYNRIEDICEYNSVDYNACAKTELIMDILRFALKG